MRGKPSEFLDETYPSKLERCGKKLLYFNFNRFWVIRACDGQTDAGCWTLWRSWTVSSTPFLARDSIMIILCCRALKTALQRNWLLTTRWEADVAFRALTRRHKHLDVHVAGHSAKPDTTPHHCMHGLLQLHGHSRTSITDEWWVLSYVHRCRWKWNAPHSHQTHLVVARLPVCKSLLTRSVYDINILQSPSRSRSFRTAPHKIQEPAGASIIT